MSDFVKQLHIWDMHHVRPEIMLYNESCVCESSDIADIADKNIANPEIYMSNEQNPGWLFDIGDEILPSYRVIITHHYKDLY